MAIIDNHHVTIKMELFTESEQRIFRVLADGKPHHVRDLTKALDELSTKENVAPHIGSIRRILMENYDIDVICKVEGRVTSYVLARRVVVRMETP